MTIEPQVVDQLRAIVITQTKSNIDPLRPDSKGWPILRQNMALFEFLRIRRVSSDELSAARAGLKADANHSRDDSRAIWAKLLLEGYDLFADSREVWVVEYGDPLQPHGVPPNPPQEGLRFFVDLLFGKTFVTAGPVELPDVTTFKSEVPERERRELSALEASLRALANRAKPAHSSLSIIEFQGAWPVLLAGEEILEVNRIEAIDRRSLEWFLEDVDRRIRLEPSFAASPSSKAERDLFVRLLDAGPVYRAWYNQPPHYGSPGYVLWLAPETEYARAEHWGWVACGPERPKNIRRVLPYGSREGSTLARYASLELEAAQQADREHYQELITQKPAIKAFLDLVQAEGYSCWRCHEVTRRVGWISLDGEGRGQFRCQACSARVVLEGPDQRPPLDLSLTKQLTGKWSCPSCRREAAAYRAMRNAPGEAWLAVCPACGCTSPAR